MQCHFKIQLGIKLENVHENDLIDTNMNFSFQYRNYYSRLNTIAWMFWFYQQKYNFLCVCVEISHVYITLSRIKKQTEKNNRM